MTIRLADHDYLSAPTDSPANTRWEGLIAPDGINTLAQINLWCWDGSAAQNIIAFEPDHCRKSWEREMRLT